MSDYKFENTIGGKLVKELKREIQECIVVSNHWLPAEFHDDVRDGRTVARLEQMCNTNAVDDETEHHKLGHLKAVNVENYRRQFEARGKIEYNGHVDEMQLYKNELAMSNACNLIENDDLLE
jgi:hypothetical protein